MGLHVPIEVRIAFRYLRSSGGIKGSLPALLTISGVLLGVASLIVVSSVWNGFEAGFLEKMLGFGAHTIVMRRFDPFREHREVAARLRTQPEIRQVAPFVHAQAIGQSSKAARGVLLQGIDPEVVSSTPLARHLGAEELQRLSGEASSAIVIGRGLQETLQVEVDDEIAIITARSFDDEVRTTPFRVAGIFETGTAEIDDRTAFVHLAAAQRLLGLEDTVTGLAVWTIEPSESERTMQASLDPAQYALFDWSKTHAAFVRLLEEQKAMIVVVLFCIVVVAAFNIMATLFLMISQKRREIAMLKALGLADRSILIIFLLDGQLIGLVGCGLGILAGLAICFALEHIGIRLDPRIHTLDRLPVLVRPLDVVLVTAGAMFLATLGAVIPASRASRLTPLDGLRLTKTS
jgi:lipoprotein-releasing system permease protein